VFVTFFGFNLSAHGVDGVGGVDGEGEGFAGQGLDGHLHVASLVLLQKNELSLVVKKKEVSHNTLHFYFSVPLPRK
jgi:hypothetical protein